VIYRSKWGVFCDTVLTVLREHLAAAPVASPGFAAMGAALTGSG
jgi:hypothetical protein